MRNTDNEPLQFCKSHFKISIAPEESLRQLLPLTLSGIEDCLQGSKRDPSGKVIQVTFDWLKAGNKKHKLWNNTVMGHISITGNTLILETNSENRDQKGVAFILKYLGEQVTFEKTFIESLEQKLQASNNHPSKADTLLHSPKVRQHIKNMMQSHWEHWFDEPISALGNKTPREAALTPKGKEELEILFLLYERSNLEQQDNGLRSDISYLRRELGMD